MTSKIILNDAFKHYTLDQDKTLTPEETVRRFKERLKGLDLDILERTERIDNGRLDIPVYFSVCGRDAHEIIGTKKQMGKGSTPQQSEASAVMELAERFSFFSFFKKPQNFLIAKYKDVQDKALAFEAISDSVHDHSEDLGVAKALFSGLSLKWAAAYNLTRHEEVLIPFDWFFAINEFNGPSAGNCVEEALSQGICEIVERHVSSLVSRNKLETPAINIDSITDPVALELIGKYQRIGVQLFISDFSLDTGIPTIGVLAYDPSTFPKTSEIVWTAGTTPSPQKALNRALTEVAQLAGDFNTSSNYVASGLPKLETIKEAELVTRSDKEKQLSQLPDLSHDNIKIEVENCISALSRIGMDVIVVNVTHPGLEIPAFYTIIPGAHFRERTTGTSIGMFAAKLITQNNSPEVAISELQRVDALMPGKYYTRFFLGSCHLSMKKPNEALKYFKQALELSPKDEDITSIYSYMGVCLRDLGQYRRAIEVLEKAEENDSARTDIYNLMGFCYFKLKEHEKAIACFNKVLELDPNSAIDYANIASNYRDMGKKDLATQYYEFALQLDPSIEFARDNLRKLGGTS